MSTVAVTGGCGFIGSWVAEALRNAGYRVRLLDKDAGQRYRDDVEFLEFDFLEASQLEVTRALMGCEAVFHLGGVANVNDAAADPVGCVRTNVLGTARVLEACRSRIGRFVLASTVWAYAATNRPGQTVLEEHPVHIDGSNHVYTSSKIAAEMLCWDFSRMPGGPQVTVLRYGIPYGARMREGMVIERFVTAALNGDKLKVMGTGAATRKYIHVADLAVAHVAALKPAAANRLYTIDGAESVSVLDVAKTVALEVNILPDSDLTALGIKGRKIEVEHLPARPGDYAGNVTSTNRAETELGWAPQVDFRTGVREYVKWRVAQRLAVLRGA